MHYFINNNNEIVCKIDDNEFIIPFNNPGCIGPLGPSIENITMTFSNDINAEMSTNQIARFGKIVTSTGSTGSVGYTGNVGCTGVDGANGPVGPITMYNGTGIYSLNEFTTGEYADAINNLRQPSFYTPIVFGTSNFGHHDKIYIGNEVPTQGTWSILIGSSVDTMIHIGTGIHVSDESISFGDEPITQQTNSIKFGSTCSQDVESISFGGSKIQQNNAISFGSNSVEQTDFSISIGHNCGDNISIGYNSGYTGINNISLGKNSSFINQSDNAISIGDYAGYKNQNTCSIAVGTNAGYCGQGAYSIAIGQQAGEYTQGDSCIAIGVNSGQTNQSLNSISIGKSSGVDITNNSILIGHNTVQTDISSDCVFTIPNLLNVTSGSALTYDTTTGKVEPSSVSSKRFKKCICELPRDYTDNLKHVKPVEFNHINSNVKTIGVLAENLAEYYPELVQFDDNGEPYSVSYSLLNVLILAEYKNLIHKLEINNVY